MVWRSFGVNRPIEKRLACRISSLSNAVDGQYPGLFYLKNIYQARDLAIGRGLDGTCAVSG